MEYTLSIILCHFVPLEKPECQNALIKTLRTIQEQKNGISVEITVADDGSIQNDSIMAAHSYKEEIDGRTFFVLEKDALSDWLKETGIDKSLVDRWIYLPKMKPCMSKARLLNYAADKAASENLFFLDDDNYFESADSVEKISILMDKYDVVFGQIRDGSGRLRSYSSRRVQGTTFGVKRNILQAAGGFGVWTEAVSSGVDSDLWYKLYLYKQQNPEMRACYTEDIRTVDACSKRWKQFIPSLLRNQKLAKSFFKAHGCKKFRNIRHNPSRIKSLWIEKVEAAEVVK